MEKISKETKQYFYLEKNKFCCDYTEKEMFSGIKSLDYYTVIDKLYKYYKCDYYKSLLPIAKEMTNNIYLQEFTENKQEKEYILTNYIKCNKNIKLIFFFPNSMPEKTNKELMNNGKILYTKSIELDFNKARNLLFLLYYNNEYLKDTQSIDKKLEQIGFQKNKKSKIIIYFYEYNGKEEYISGHRAIFKEKLRQIVNEKGINGSSFLHINDYFYQSIELSEMLLNENFINILSKQIFTRFISGYMSSCKKLFLTYKNWFIQNIPLIERQRFLMFSSIVLYILGLRSCNDIDIYIHYLPKISNEIKKKLDKYLFNEKTKFFFIDASLKGMNEWVKGGKKEYLDEWFLKEWVQLFGADTMDTVIFNPKFHMYFMGIKIISLEGDIVRRSKRGRPASFADLIGLKMLIDENIKIPELQKEFWQSNIKQELTKKKQINEIISKIQFYLKKRFNIHLTKENIHKLIPNYTNLYNDLLSLTPAN